MRRFGKKVERKYSHLTKWTQKDPQKSVQTRLKHVTFMDWPPIFYFLRRIASREKKRKRKGTIHALTFLRGLGASSRPTDPDTDSVFTREETFLIQDFIVIYSHQAMIVNLYLYTQKILPIILQREATSNALQHISYMFFD